jgi:hypothetical protein
MESQVKERTQPQSATNASFLRDSSFSKECIFSGWPATRAGGASHFLICCNQLGGVPIAGAALPATGSETSQAWRGFQRLRPASGSVFTEGNAPWIANKATAPIAG